MKNTTVSIQRLEQIATYFDTQASLCGRQADRLVSIADKLARQSEGRAWRAAAKVLRNHAARAELEVVP